MGRLTGPPAPPRLHFSAGGARRPGPRTSTEMTTMTGRTITRRGFVQGTLGGAAALGLGLRPSWAAEPTGQPAAGKIGDFKISLAEWSLHRALRAKNAEITNLDFPRIAREQYGIDGVEFVNQ